MFALPVGNGTELGLPGPQAVDELLDSDVQSPFDVCAMTCSDKGKTAAQAEKRIVVSRIVRLCLPNFVSFAAALGRGTSAVEIAKLSASLQSLLWQSCFQIFSLAVVSRYWHIHVARKDLALANRWSELLQAYRATTTKSGFGQWCRASVKRMTFDAPD